MPLHEKVPQKHPPGCWRWSNHWQCAVDLVDRLAGILEDIQAAYATVTERGIEVVITPDLGARIDAALTEVEGEE
ncbi:MAG: hypothetical protein GWN58_25740 [Anaerolineae bacterium]|nr:hypothetical protein [Anaerolineae bacterium]